MPEEESRLNLESDIPAVRAFLALYGGGLVEDKEERQLYWLALRPVSAPRQTYVARVRWDTYPQRPPSLVFASARGGGIGDPTDWPNVPGYRAPNDICMPFTAEGFTTHPEWVNGPEAWN